MKQVLTPRKTKKLKMASKLEQMLKDASEHGLDAKKVEAKAALAKELLRKKKNDKSNLRNYKSWEKLPPLEKRINMVYTNTTNVSISVSGFISPNKMNKTHDLGCLKNSHNGMTSSNIKYSINETVLLETTGKKQSGNKRRLMNRKSPDALRDVYSLNGSKERESCVKKLR